jgi:uncharacterized protein YxeA
MGTRSTESATGTANAKSPASRAKRIAIVTVVAVVALLCVLGAMWGGKAYSDARYAAPVAYYARVAQNVDTTPQEVYDYSNVSTDNVNPVDGYNPDDENGTDLGFGVQYSLLGYDADGNTQSITLNVLGDATDNAPQPGDYLRIRMSGASIVDWQIVNSDSIPSAAMDRINQEAQINAAISKSSNSSAPAASSSSSSRASSSASNSTTPFNFTSPNSNANESNSDSSDSDEDEYSSDSGDDSDIYTSGSDSASSTSED